MGSPVARGRVSPQRRSRRGRGLSPWVWKPPWKRAQQPLQRGPLQRGPLENPWGRGAWQLQPLGPHRGR